MRIAKSISVREVYHNYFDYLASSIKNLPLRIVILVYFFVLTTSIDAQISDIARLEYVGIPGQSNQVSYDRFRAMINYPIKVKEDAYFVVGLDYSTVNLEIDPAIVDFDTESLRRFQLIDLNLGYTYKINTSWRFAARLAPGISSNLTASSLNLEDVAFSADIVFINNKKDAESPKKPTQLILGVSISNNRGFPILPFVSYYHKFHDKWSYNLGVPKSNLQWHISEKHRLKSVVRIDGFSGNLQNDIPVGDDLADRFRLQLLVAGLRYEYKWSKNIESYINGSYIFSSSAILRRGTRTNLLEVTDKNPVYIKTGLRFKV